MVEPVGSGRRPVCFLGEIGENILVIRLGLQTGFEGMEEQQLDNRAGHVGIGGPEGGSCFLGFKQPSADSYLVTEVVPAWSIGFRMIWQEQAHDAQAANHDRKTGQCITDRSHRPTSAGLSDMRYVSA